MKQHIFLLLCLVVMHTEFCTASSRQQPKSAKQAKSSAKISAKDLARFNTIQGRVAKDITLSNSAKDSLRNFLEIPGIRIYPYEHARLIFALESDINDVVLSEQTFLSSALDFNRINVLLAYPNYDLMRMDPNGQRRVDIVMNFSPHVYARAIFTAFSNGDQHLLDEMAQILVNNAQSGENIVSIVRNLRSEQIDESFIDTLMRLAHTRFSTESAKNPKEAKRN